MTDTSAFDLRSPGQDPVEHPLLIAVRALLDGASIPSTRIAYEQLSARYRSGERARARLSDADVLAYLAARLPATFATMLRVLHEVRSLLPDWQPSSLLDLGAGPGTASTAATAVFSSITRCVLIEMSDAMVEIGRSLASESPSEAMRRATWSESNAAAPSDTGDLVLAAYLLGELETGSRAAAVEQWWNATGGCLVLVEPGTPAGYERIIEARRALIQAGGHVVAPCPHDALCPLVDGDWCHFAVRVGRSAVHRSVKSATRSFEDEKFSYLIVTRSEPRRSARVIRRPVERSGYVRLQICASDGLSERVFSRRQGSRYATARRLTWGDRVPDDILEANPMA